MSAAPAPAATGVEAGAAAPHADPDRARLDEEARAGLAVMAAGDRAVVGLSGGPDSVALAHLVARVRPDLDVAAAHVLHGLRQPAADEGDARIAAAHAEALGWPLERRSVQVAESGDGVEAAARRVRAEALSAVAHAIGASWVMLAHTADDLAETVVMNLARGTGLSGLGGMPPVHEHGDGVAVVRPLLASRRASMRGLVAAEDLPTAHDPSNDEPRRRRTRARDEALPALARLHGGDADPVGPVARMARLARADAEALDQWAEQRHRETVASWGPARVIRLGELAALPEAVASRVVRLVLAEVGDPARLDAAAVAAATELGPGEAVHVPGGAWVTAGGGWLAAVPAAACSLQPRELRLPGAVEPGAVELPELGFSLVATAEGRRGADAPLSLPGPGASGPWRVTLPLSWCVTRRLRVRPPHPGDRLRLPRGVRKLAELLADRGVPRAIRALVPVVTSDDDEPLWVPGVAVRTGAGPAAYALSLSLERTGVRRPSSSG
jgi:tRNA(Ile)-lysidine synthase